MLSDRKLSKIERLLGEKIEVFNASQDDELERSIINAESNIKKAQEELETNPKYQELKEGLKAISEGLKELKKYSNASIQYALHLLEERGEK